jgi:hypothetical protein
MAFLLLLSLMVGTSNAAAAPSIETIDGSSLLLQAPDIISLESGEGKLSDVVGLIKGVRVYMFYHSNLHVRMDNASSHPSH